MPVFNDDDVRTFALHIWHACSSRIETPVEIIMHTVATHLNLLVIGTPGRPLSNNLSARLLCSEPMPREAAPQKEQA